MSTQDMLVEQNQNNIDFAVPLRASMDTVPHRWNIARLEDISDIVMGQSPPSETYNKGGQGLPFLQGKAEFTDLYPAPTVYCTKPLKIAKQGSTLISVRAPVGDVNLADQIYAIGRGLASIMLKQGDKHFLFYLLLHNKEKFKIQGSGTTFESINRVVLDNFLVALPPLPEQRAIARILQTVQHAIQARRKELLLERERKAALMQHLFTHGTRNEPTKMSEIGEIPESWRVSNLEDLLLETQYGLSLAGSSSGMYPILRMNNLVEGTLSYKDLQYVNLDEATLQKFRLNNGDILFNRTNSYELVGKTSLFERDGSVVFASYLIRLISDRKQLQPAFLNWYLNWTMTQRRLKTLASRGVSQSNISASKLQRFKIAFPPIIEGGKPTEQDEIIEILNACDSKITTLEKEVALLEELFRALLDELMTGRLSALPLVEQ